MATAQRDRLEALHDKQQRQGLTSAEQIEERALLELYHETILVRAQAAVLLKQRGYDVSELMNHADIVAARKLWVLAGWHPPTD